MTQKKSPEIRKEEIFKAALSCFNRSGYFQTTIDDIAREAGLTKGAIYYHFKSKKNLFIELFHNRVNRYFNSLKDNLDHDAPSGNRLRRIVEKSENILDQNRDIFQFCLEFVAMSTRDSDIRNEVTRFYKDRVAAFSGIIREGIEAGRFKNLDPDGVARVLYVLSMGVFLTYFTVNLDFDPVEQHNLYMNILFNGIQKNEPLHSH